MRVIVSKPFRLTADDGTFTDYAVGEHDMPEVHATHWYTRLFAKVSGEVKEAEKVVEEVVAEVKATVDTSKGKGRA